MPENQEQTIIQLIFKQIITNNKILMTGQMYIIHAEYDKIIKRIMNNGKEVYIPYNRSLVYAVELVSKAFNEAARKFHNEMKFEINHEEFRILETIYLNPGIIQINIAKSILMKRSYVCKFLNQLEEKGYIRKEKAIRGKRQIIMENYITPAGEEVYFKVIDYIEKDIIAKSKDYNEEEVTKIRDILIDIATRIKHDFKLKY